MKRRGALLSPLALAACAAPPKAADTIDLADGFAALEGGTRGGAGARPEHRFDVHSRAQLEAALALGDVPKHIRLHTRIDLADGKTDADFRDTAFDLDAYCRAFDPATWGRRPPQGALEDARRRSSARQAAAVTLHVPPRTTLQGAVPGAGFSNGMLLLDGTHDIVLAHLQLGAVQDHFPQWDPLDGADGEWNSDYDLISLRRSHHVWVHQCSLSSAGPPQPRRLDRLFQQNDGLLDITRQSDLVTVSHCHFSDHDKTLLIGSSDSQTEDRGHLRVSLHHNRWQRCAERTPRVRFGQVHVANNLFEVPDAHRFGYSIGVGIDAQIVSEVNVWDTAPTVPATRLVRLLKGNRLLDSGSLHNGAPLDLRALPLGPPPGFTPPPIRGRLPAREVAAYVRSHAGSGRGPM